MRLHIAYKNYSSWSLRPWIAMKVAGIEFEEDLLPFAHGDELAKLGARLGVPAKVPMLEVDGLVLWESLAILEYLAERYPERGLWPADADLRALARCAAAEMHSGFTALRTSCPMNCRASKKMTPSAAVEADLRRLAEIWARFEAVDKPAGDFLCGAFSNVDAMYAPVMWRVRGYGLAVSPAFARWAEAVYALPAMREWEAAAQAESWTMPEYDAAG